MKRLTLNIFRNKSRAFLTITGISVGVFSVVLISSIGSIGTRQVSQTLTDMGINSVMVQAKQQYSAVTLNSDDIETVSYIKGVNKAMPLMAANTEVILLNKNVPCLAWGVNSDAGEIISLEASHGRLINSADINGGKMVCVIDADVALRTYGRSNVVGKTAKILVGGAYRDFEIIGVASSGISMLQTALSGLIPNFVYIPFSTMQRLTGRTSFDKIAVLINDGEGGEAVTEQIEIKLNNQKGYDWEKGQTALTVSNLLQQKGQLESIMSTVTVILSLIAGISLFVSGLTVMTTMLVSVNERKREIGIKKSIGARDLDIMREFLSESIILALVGSVIGAFLAIVTALTGCYILGMDFIPGILEILIPILVSVVMGVMFGGYPALKAARLEPIEALRN